MKKVINVILSLILSLIGIVAVILLLLNILQNKNTLSKIASLANYYDDSYPVFVDNLKHQVGNEELQKVVENVVTKDRVKKDIDKILANGSKAKASIGESIKEDLTKELKLELKDNYEEEALTNLISILGDTYQSSLFPNEEYEVIYKVLDKIPMITPIFIGTIIFFVIVAFLILLLNKDGYSVVAVSNYLTGLFLLFPYLFCNLGGLFKNFYYTNAYWTIFIKKTISYLLNTLAIAGIVFIVLGILIQVFKKLKEKD